MQEELDHFINISKDVKEKPSYTIGWASAVTAVFPYLLSGAVYLVVTAKAWCGAIGIGGIVQYVGAMSRFAGSLQKLVKKLTEVISNNEFLRETFEFLDRENTKYQGTIPTEKRLDNEFLIEFKDVSFKYPGTDAWALRHLNLTLRIGERLAVVGRNGSGKTTMIKLLCRLYDPTEGVITLNGIDIRKYNYDEYMALFSVVFQDYHLFSFQLGQSVAASVKYDKERVLHDLREAGLGELLEKMQKAGARVDGGDFLAAARDAGSEKAVNIALMGRLSGYFPEITREDWREAVAEVVPARFRELNLRAFELGRSINLTEK